MLLRRCLVLTLILALTLAACGGTGGSATGQRQSCTSRSGVGTCEGSFDRIRGRYIYTLADVPASRGTLIAVRVQAGAESGALRIELTGPDGESVSAIAQPGAPADVEGTVPVDAFENVPIVFEVVEGEAATDVAYTIDWQVP